MTRTKSLEWVETNFDLGNCSFCGNSLLFGKCDNKDCPLYMVYQD